MTNKTITTLIAALLSATAATQAKESFYGDFPRYPNEANAILQQAGAPESYRENRDNGTLPWHDDLYLSWWTERELTRTADLEKLYYGAIDHVPWIQDWFTNQDGSIVCIWAQGGNYFVNDIYVFRKDPDGIYRKISHFNISSGCLPLLPEETKFSDDGLSLTIGHKDKSLTLTKKFLFENKEESWKYLTLREEIDNLPAPQKRSEPDARQQEFILAIQNNRQSQAAQLLEQGADIHAQDFLNRTALHWAAQEGHTDLVRLLLEAGADINAQDVDKQTPLMLALLHNRPDSVREILNRQPDLELANDREFDGSYTALQIACSAAAKTSPDIVRELIEAGANVNNAQPTQGITPLMITVFAGKEEIAKILLQAGADPNATYRGKTALDLARSYHRQALIDLLEPLTASKPLPDDH